MICDYTDEDFIEYSEEDWTMRDGQTIKLKDMTHSHLHNVTNMLIRNAQNYESSAWSSYTMVQGEMAEYYLSHAIDNAQNTVNEILIEADKLKQYADWKNKQ